MGNWIPDMWQPKVAHDAHNTPTSFSEFAMHIRDQHPGLLDDESNNYALSPEGAARIDEIHDPEHIQHLIRAYTRKSHPEDYNEICGCGSPAYATGTDGRPICKEHLFKELGDAGLLGGREEAKPLESHPEAYTRKFPQKDVSNEICGCGSPAYASLDGRPICKEHLSVALGGIELGGPEKAEPLDSARQEIDNIPSFTNEEWKAKGITWNGEPHTGSASAPEPSIHDTFRALQGVEHQYTMMSRQLRAQGLDTEADAHAEHARSARMGLDALRRMIEQQ